jgi:hypothetical protein
MYNENNVQSDSQIFIKKLRDYNRIDYKLYDSKNFYQYINGSTSEFKNLSTGDNYVGRFKINDDYAVVKYLHDIREKLIFFVFILIKIKIT